MTFLRADVGFLPIVLVWGFLFAISRLKASGRGSRPGAPSAGASPGGAHDGMMEQLRRGMEELKRAQMTEIAREQGAAGAAGASAGDERAKAYLTKRLRVDVPRPAASKPVRKAPAPVYRRGEDDEGSQEAPELAPAEEGTDYDLEVERQADARRAETEMQWHLGQASAREITSPPAFDAPPPPARKPLARYADGSARSALILSILLGRPRSE